MEKLRHVFARVPGLMAADASLTARTGSGFLLKGEPRELALALLRELALEEIEAVALAESELPALPPTKFIKRIDCTSEGLVIYDVLGRPVTAEWNRVALVAAGKVKMLEAKREAAPGSAFGDDDLIFDRAANHRRLQRLWGTILAPDASRDSADNQISHERLILEVLLENPAARYTVEATPENRMLFESLGERRTRDFEQNYLMLVQTMAAGARKAMLNRGAVAAVESGEIMAYPSRHAFADELVWLLWLAAQPDAGR